MQLSLDQPRHEYVLRGADGSGAKVNDRILTRSFVIAPSALLEAWAATAVGEIQPTDLEPLFQLQPEVILIGGGDRQGFIPAIAQAAALKRGIGIEVMTNAAAARTFNVLASEDRRVVAGFLFPA
ncbi:MAG: MTH938/NDUFAF3 family protein [Pseudomonadota bacterium]|nr:MTH938/NDUFAF3 family protein [Pseudomonadota bacterium]